MNSKKILNKTILFILILAFMTAFIGIFGDDNSLFGVIIILLSLTLLSQDLSRNPIQNFLEIVTILLIMCIGAYISCLYPILSLFIIFMIIFSTTFLITNNLKYPTYFPFILGFLFMLSSPIKDVNIGLRLISLIFGAAFIVGLNLLINRNRFIKSSKAGLKNIIDDIIKLIQHKKNNEEIDDHKLIENTNRIKNEVYDSLKKNYFSKPKNIKLINIATGLQQIGLTIENNNLSKKQLNLLEKLFVNIKDNPDDKNNIKIIEDIIQDNEFHYGILSNLKIILFELKHDNIIANIDKKVPTNFKIKTILKSNFSIHSFKFTFSLKLAILITIFEFIELYSGIYDARWLSYTTVAILQPYADHVSAKAKSRITGTVEGVALFMILYIFCDFLQYQYNIALNASISILIILVSYLGSLYEDKNYTIVVLFVTLPVLLMSLLNADNGAVLNRLVFIITGCVISFIATYYILPYTLYDEDVLMIKKYNEINKEEIKILKNSLNATIDENKTSALILKATLLEEKIRTNNFQDNNQEVEKILQIQNQITERTMFLRNTLKVSKLTESEKKDALKLFNGEKVNTKCSFLLAIDELLKLYNKSNKLIGDLVEG